MGIGKGGGGISPQIQEGMLQNETALTNIAQQQEGNAQQLYNLTEPGLGTAENFYQTLASGDPTAIMQAIAPAAQSAAQASAGAKSNIEANAPAGGEKNLALEMTDVNRAAQVSGTASQASLGANNALASLAEQGIGESLASTSAATSALSTGGQTLSSLGGLQLQSQEVQMQEKGQSMWPVGMFANIAGDVFANSSSFMPSGGPNPSQPSWSGATNSNELGLWESGGGNPDMGQLTTFFPSADVV